MCSSEGASLYPGLVSNAFSVIKHLIKLTKEGSLKNSLKKWINKLLWFFLSFFFFFLPFYPTGKTERSKMGKGHWRRSRCSQMTEQSSYSIFKFSTAPNSVAGNSYMHPYGTFHLEGSQCTILIGKAFQKPSYTTHCWSDTEPTFCSSEILTKTLEVN